MGGSPGDHGLRYHTRYVRYQASTAHSVPSSLCDGSWKYTEVHANMKIQMTTRAFRATYNRLRTILGSKKVPVQTYQHAVATTSESTRRKRKDAFLLADELESSRKGVSSSRVQPQPNLTKNKTAVYLQMQKQNQGWCSHPMLWKFETQPHLQSEIIEINRKDFYLQMQNQGWCSHPMLRKNGGQDYDPILDWISWDDGGSKEEGPVLSSVTVLEPVYSFSSRSGYQHGRRVSVQTSYTPGKPAYNDEPVYKGGPGKGSLKGAQSGGFDSIADSSLAAGKSKKSGQDSGAYDPIPDWISWDEGGSEGLEEGKGEEEEGPVLSSVADLEPVYSFSSRSGYRHGRRVYSQTSYTPGEPTADDELVYKGGPGKGSPKRFY
ncbi:hypothetical protein CRUP_003843 [Coryphaenoides rupestris]|nr:hypothetical protein CRUP_003843 [Coryphaenoides rupestris]